MTKGMITICRQTLASLSEDKGAPANYISGDLLARHMACKELGAALLRRLSCEGYDLHCTVSGTAFDP